MKNRFVGIDCSLAATGYVVLDEGGIIIASGEITSQPMKVDIVRYDSIITRLVEAIHPTRKDKVLFEQYAFSRKGHVTRFAELGGQMKREFYKVHGIQANYIWACSAPTLKKYATGKGNVGKGAVIKAVYKKWDLDTDSDNIADAFVLAKIMRDCFLYPSTIPSSKYEVECIKSLRKQNNVPTMAVLV